MKPLIGRAIYTCRKRWVSLRLKETPPQITLGLSTARAAILLILEKHSLYKIVVIKRIKVVVESIPISFRPFIPLEPEQLTLEWG